MQIDETYGWSPRQCMVLTIFTIAMFCTTTNYCQGEPKEKALMMNDLPEEFKTMRPIRMHRDITLTVGQGEGELQGNDDKIIQAAVDYVHRLGGGTVQVLPGIYTMRNSVYLRSGIALLGSGENTVLKKDASVTTTFVREADWYEYAVQVMDSTGFTRGCGIALSTAKQEWPALRIYTVTAVQGNVLYLNQRTEKNYFMSDSAKAQTLFPILHGLNVNDVTIKDIVLDGNRTENDHINGNYAGAVFMQYCDRWTFKNVTARNYNGDGFSFQVCDDIHFENCHALNNADLGFHAGSGAQRPIFKNCTSKGNGTGFFWCWGVCDGVAEDCVASDNKRHGVNFGHRDTDNVIRNCTIEHNGEVGIIFRKEVNEYRTPDRNRIENCVIRDNGKFGIDIQWKTKDVTISSCQFESTQADKQKIAIHISPEAERVNLDGNKFINCQHVAEGDGE